MKSKKGGDFVLDPMSCVGAFWNGVAYLDGLKNLPTLLKFAPAIATITVVALIFLGAKFINKKQAR